MPSTIGTIASQAIPHDLILLAHNSSPFISVYTWNPRGASQGWGTKYANPASLPAGNGYKIVMHPSGKSIAITHFTTPFVSAYAWTYSGGFGSKYSDPSPVVTKASVSNGEGIAFSPDGNDFIYSYFGGGSANPPYFNAHAWTNSSGFGTQYSNPATQTTSDAGTIQWSPSGADIVIPAASTGTTSATAYPWSSGFGTKYANPATANGGRGVAWAPNGNDVLMGNVPSSGTERIVAYTWSSGWGTKYSAPATPPAGNVSMVDWNPTGSAVGCSHFTTPFTTAYPWSAGFGTKYADPASLPLLGGFSFKWSKREGKDLAVGFDSSPRIYVYPWSSGFGTKYADPATLPPAVVRGIDWYRG